MPLSHLLYFSNPDVYPFSFFVRISGEKDQGIRTDSFASHDDRNAEVTLVVLQRPRGCSAHDIDRLGVRTLILLTSSSSSSMGFHDSEGKVPKGTLASMSHSIINLLCDFGQRFLPKDIFQPMTKLFSSINPT